MLRILVFLIALLPAACLAQSNGVRQSGNVSPGHVACWTISGIIQDGGTSVAPFCNEMALVGNGTGAPFAIDTNPTTGPFNQFLAGFDGSNLYLSLTALGGATHIPLELCVNGNCGLTVTDTGLSLQGIVTTGTGTTVSSGAADCGTAPTIAGNDNAGRVVVGSGLNGGFCTVHFSKPWANKPVCIGSDTQTDGARSWMVPVITTTTMLIDGGPNTMLDGDTLTYICLGYD